MTGGASGVPQGMGEKVLPMETRKMSKLEPRPDVPVKKFRVVNGGIIVYNNCRTMLRQGKIISEREYDLKRLRAQGVVLKELEDEAPAAES